MAPVYRGPLVFNMKFGMHVISRIMGDLDYPLSKKEKVCCLTIFENGWK